MFSNLRGCDGARIYFNGGSSISLNGEILNRGKQFALQDVEVTVATFDLEDIRRVSRDNTSLDNEITISSILQVLQKQHKISNSSGCPSAALSSR